MIFRQFHTPELAIYSYLVGDQATGRAAVIDPTRDVGIYVEAARAARVEIVAIIETHVHADFVSGAKELKKALGDKPCIYASKMGGAAWTPVYADRPVSDGDEVQLGSLRLRARHTPGHTPEHLVWLFFDESRSRDVPWLLFSGDLIFVGGVGRPDLLGEGELELLSKQLYHSLFKTLADLPDYVEIYPAHGAGSLCGKGMSDRTTSTLGYERSFNPSLKPLPEAVWVEELNRQMPAFPLHFQRIKRINVAGPAQMSGQLLELQEAMQNAFMIDVRDPLKFAESHIAGSVNIPFGAAFCNWAEMVVPEDRPIVFVVPQGPLAHQLQRQFRLIGFETAGYVVWDKVSQDVKETLTVFSPRQLFEEGKRQIIDVRTPGEWDAGHIEGARHIELASIPKALKELSTEQPLALICGSGYRSSVAASYLKAAGFSDVGSVRGGMQGWRQAGLPIV